jgi:hypothetical protein
MQSSAIIVLLMLHAYKFEDKRSRLITTSKHNRYTALLLYGHYLKKPAINRVSMQFQRLAILTALAALTVAQDITQDDIPQQCTAVCTDVVSISRRCDNTTGMRLAIQMRMSLSDTRRKRDCRTRLHLPRPKRCDVDSNMRSLRCRVRQR